MPNRSHIENWWTRRTSYNNSRTPLQIATARVRYYLKIYPRLAKAAVHGSSLWAADDDARRLYVVTAEDYLSGPAWLENILIKADLDHALKRCTRKQRQAVHAKFLTAQDVSYDDAAKSLPGRPDVYRLCGRAIATMGKSLVGKNNEMGGSRRGYIQRPASGGQLSGRLRRSN